MSTLLGILIACSPTGGGPAGPDDTGPTADPDATAPGLVINEILAVNQSTNTDASGAYADWIELHNPTGASVSLRGLYLTDEDDEPKQFALPAAQDIAAGGYALFWADANPSQGDDHATFKLSGSGEYVGLYFVAEGKAPVAVDAVEFGAQVADVSAARVPDGSLDWRQGTPTPGASNGE